MMKEIVLLGASGSIGLQTVDVCLQHKNKFKIIGISVGRNIEVLLQLLEKIEVRYVCTSEYQPELIDRFKHIQFFHGDEGLLSLVQVEYHLLVNALVGFVGVKPTLKAISLNKDVALANKETLVVAGEFVYKLLEKHHVKLLPIDSEHSAIFQALQGNQLSEVKRLIITASGGSFRDKTRNELNDVTLTQALQHPNWAMGAKITIDSATMMNKGFEVIEAHWLFNIPYEKIDVIMHPQSIVHSLVEYVDGSQMAQLGLSDMRIPIQYALAYPQRLPLISESLQLETIGTLQFKPVSYERFPLLKVAIEVGKAKGSAPCILNAANEIANAAFIANRISFLDIERLIIKALKNIPHQTSITLEELFEIDQKTRAYVLERIETHDYGD